ncbi:protein containing C-terminal RING-finger [Trypanosoma grayi]|uniref:protein containing C-terminal RING-finger n=1 Tax=Trypanosoma grayi TaxID=71804 RepID=UPI0004F41582|nr:protein containing C-terminal RING-finger [Trypanosoma grayi]KEG06916.1 protein containing C-terminal RING-finger [Trypanosoma grayi]
MDGGNGPKRARSEPTERSPSTATPPASTAEPPLLDPSLENLLRELDLDDDFKASLRSMSPRSRMEVINDIVRGQQVEGFQRFFLSLRSQAVPASQPARPSVGGVDLRAFPRVAAGDDDDDDNDDDEEVVEALPRLSSDLLLRLLRNPQLPREPLLQGLLVRGYEVFELANVLGEVMAQRSLGMTQDIDDMSYEQLLELQERIGYVSKGITQEQIRQCMTDVPNPKEGSCVVCQGDLQERQEEGDKAVELKKCHHRFHFKCIEQWFGSNKTCPVCKQEVV